MDHETLTVQERLPELDPSETLPALEGLLFAAGTEGLSDEEIARVFRVEENDVIQLVDTLRARQEAEGRMFRVTRIADTWQLVTAPELAPYLRALALAPPPSPLSQAALETLAIIAYRQPITRLAIEEIRGVKSDRALGTLTARGLIEEVGRSAGPGRPYLYATTRDFLDYFGLGSPDELPPLPTQTLEDPS